MVELVRNCPSEFKEYYIQMQVAKRSQAPLPSQVKFLYIVACSLLVLVHYYMYVKATKSTSMLLSTVLFCSLFTLFLFLSHSRLVFDSLVPKVFLCFPYFDFLYLMRGWFLYGACFTSLCAVFDTGDCFHPAYGGGMVVERSLILLIHSICLIRMLLSKFCLWTTKSVMS